MFGSMVDIQSVTAENSGGKKEETAGRKKNGLPFWAAIKTLITLDYITTTTTLRPLFQDYPGEPVSEEKLLDFMVKGKINRSRHIQLGATPPRLTSAHLHHPPLDYNTYSLY